MQVALPFGLMLFLKFQNVRAPQMKSKIATAIVLPLVLLEMVLAIGSSADFDCSDFSYDNGDCLAENCTNGVDDDNDGILIATIQNAQAAGHVSLT